MRRSLDGCRALLTGASSGIGRALAFELAAQRTRLVMVARRQPLLESLASQFDPTGQSVAVVAGDITDPRVRRRAIDAAQNRWGGLDLVINNAGIGSIAPFAQEEEERLRRIMEVNFFAAAELTRLALPLLERGRAPLVVNISSVLGRCGLPDYVEYCASKFALEGFSQSLRRELAPRGVAVLVVAPSTTQSEFFDHLLARQGPWGKAGQHGVSAESVARQTVKAIVRGRRELVPSAAGRWLLRAERWAPGLLDWLLVHGVGKRSRGMASESP